MRRFLITAADSALGKELIKKLCETNIDDIEWIFGTYYDAKETLDELIKEYPMLNDKLILKKVDMSKIEEIEVLVKEIEDKEPITDMVHFPAPKARPLQFKKMTWDIFRANMEISFRSAVLILFCVLPRMAKEKVGKVVLMSSIYALEEATPNFLSAYVSTKSAMIGLTRSLAKEYEDKNIQINSLAPDFTDTKFLDDMPDVMKDIVVQKSERKRMLNTDEVIEKMMELLDKDNIDNGKVLVVK